MKPLQYVACLHRNKWLSWISAGGGLVTWQGSFCKLWEDRLQQLVADHTMIISNSLSPFLLVFIFSTLTQVCLIYQAPLFCIFSLGFWTDCICCFCSHSFCCYILSSLSTFCGLLIFSVLQASPLSLNSFNRLNQSGINSLITSVIAFGPKWCISCIYSTMPLGSSSVHLMLSSHISLSGFRTKKRQEKRQAEQKFCHSHVGYGKLGWHPE